MTAQSESHDHDLYDTNKRLYTTEHGASADKGKSKLQDPAVDKDAHMAQLVQMHL